MKAIGQTAYLSQQRSAAQRLAFRLALLSLTTAFVVIIEPAPTDLFFSLALLVLMLAGMRNLLLAPVLILFFALFFLFAILNVVSLFLAHSFAFGIKYLLITIYLLLIPLVLSHFSVLYGRLAIDQMYLAFTIGAAFSAVIGLMAVMGVAPGPVTLYFRAEDGLRLSPLFKDPNVYGPYMAAAGFLLLSRCCTPFAKWRGFGFMLAGFILLMMFLTFSRGAWINSAVVLAIFLLGLLVFGRSTQQLKWLFILSGLVALTVLVAAPIVLAKLGLSDFFSSRAQLQAYDSQRFANWAEGIAMIQLEPLGIGPGHYVGRNRMADSQFNLAAHNVYIKVIVENGWLGFVTFFGAITALLLLLFISFFKFDERLPIRIMLFAILMGQIANSIVVDSLHWRHFFIVTGFACAELALQHHTKRLRSQLSGELASTAYEANRLPVKLHDAL